LLGQKRTSSLRVNTIPSEDLLMKRLLVVPAFLATASVASAQAVAVTLSEWKVVMARDTVKAGSVTFNVKNGGTMAHAFYVLGEGVAKGSREIPARQEAPLTLTLKPGTYEIYCPMSDQSHKMAGMKGTLVVTAADKPAVAAPKKKPGA